MNKTKYFRHLRPEEPQEPRPRPPFRVLVTVHNTQSTFERWERQEAQNEADWQSKQHPGAHIVIISAPIRAKVHLPLPRTFHCWSETDYDEIWRHYNRKGVTVTREDHNEMP